MTALIALVIQVLITLVMPNATESQVIVIPPMPHVDPINSWVIENDDDADWNAFEYDAYCEYSDAFTALFDSYETKRAKNGALMIRRGNSGSYRFAKKG
jgi:hypothetical protein